MTQGWLDEAGIRTVADLRSIGSLEAYRRLKFMFSRQVSLNALYGLEAALREALRAKVSVEVRVRIEEILRQLKNPRLTAEQVAKWMPDEADRIVHDIRATARMQLGGELEMGRTDTGGVHLRAWLPVAA